MTTSVTDNTSAQSRPAVNGATTPSSSQVPRRLDPLEVGWQFVQEYYTILNKDPSRLHCFYNKQSTMLHGVEAETVKMCLGQHEIFKRFKELDLQDSRVIVSNVDAQSSLTGGILVCVLGELQTKQSPSRKFAQTFFLAEQPNGYFVLNDIFRFLKEDYDEVELNENEAEKEEKVELAGCMDVNGTVESVPNGPVEASEPPAPEETTTSNHSWTSTSSEVPTVAAPEAVKPVIVSPPAPVPADVKETNSPTLPPTAPSPQKSTPSVVPPKEPVVEPQIPSASQEPKSNAAPKTWASLADNGKERWAKHAATEIKASVVPPVNQHTSPPSERRASKVNGGPKETNGQGFPRPRRDHGVTVFIRGFTKTTRLNQLKDEFPSQVGVIRWVDMVSEGSAFVEFENAEGAKKALELGKVTINGETIIIEPKEKGGPRRPSNRPARVPNPKLSKHSSNKSSK